MPHQVISPRHKRAEGRATVACSELQLKPPQYWRIHKIFLLQLNVKFWDLRTSLPSGTAEYNL
jgi:hypothetical protein